MPTITQADRVSLQTHLRRVLHIAGHHARSTRNPRRHRTDPHRQRRARHRRPGGRRRRAILGGDADRAGRRPCRLAMRLPTTPASSAAPLLRGGSQPSRNSRDPAVRTLAQAPPRHGPDVTGRVVDRHPPAAADGRSANGPHERPPSAVSMDGINPYACPEPRVIPAAEKAASARTSTASGLRCVPGCGLDRCPVRNSHCSKRHAILTTSAMTDLNDRIRNKPYSTRPQTFDARPYRMPRTNGIYRVHPFRGIAHGVPGIAPVALSSASAARQ